MLPIKLPREKKRLPITFWDVESPRAWDRPELVCWVRDDGHRGAFHGSGCMEAMKAHAERERGIYVAHYGGGYDTLLMLNVWPMAELHLTGSSVLCAKDAPDLEFRDSFPWWLNGLGKVGKAVGLEKLDVDRSRLHTLTTQELESYCYRDCDIGLRGVEAANAFLDEHGAKRAWTAGSSACNLLRALEPGSWGILKTHRVLAEDAREFLTNANVGARVEAWVRGEVSPVYCYDIKSSYPARYAKTPLGVGMRRAEPGDDVGVWLCRWRWPYRDRIPPALDRGSGAGVGECQSWLIDEEIEAFENLGVVVEKLEGWCPVEVCDIGQIFVDEMYRGKEAADVSAFFCKVWLNSLHGRFMMRPLREKFTRWRPKEWWGPIPPTPVGLVDGPGWTGDRGEPLWWRYWQLDVQDDGKLRPTQQPIAGALILGRARIALWRIVDAVLRSGFRIFYSDTDSVHTDCPPERMRSIIGENAYGKALGQLNYEGGPYQGIYLGPKAYLLVDEKGEVVKQALKGVPLRSYADGVRAVRAGDPSGVFYRQARGDERGTDLRVAVFRDALGGGARCKKHGLATFLKGVAQTEDDDRPSWQKSDEKPRTIRPTSRGKVATPQGFAYLSSLECVARDLLLRVQVGGKIGKGEEWDWLAAQGYLSGKKITPAGIFWLDTVLGKSPERISGVINAGDEHP